MDTKRLCELTSAADSLELKTVVDLTSRALARVIEGKNPEDICKIFHLPDDLTEEEKLEPIKNTMDDPRIRLLNRLYARKRKELKERDSPKNKEVREEHADDRSVDDLLSFINGGNKGRPDHTHMTLQILRGLELPKNKKKNRKRKDHHKTASSNCSSTSNSTSSSSNVADISKKEPNELDSVCANPLLRGKLLTNACNKTKLLDIEDNELAAEDAFDDCDLEDDIDPALKEQIDREVEDFARRLNSDWPERMQEILSLGQDKRPIQLTSSFRRLTRLDQCQR